MEWRTISYANNFEVSEFGHIRHVKFKRIRKASIHKSYLRISLRAKGKIITKDIHRIVAEAFIENIHNLPVVDHIDRDQFNNHYKNLRWCTEDDNRSNSSGRKVISLYLDDVTKKWVIYSKKRKIHNVFDNLDDAVLALKGTMT